MNPSSGPYKAGDVLTCMSDGYPEPSYTWTDSDGVVVSNGPKITLTNSSFVLNCTASGNLTEECSASVVADSSGMLLGLLVNICMKMVCTPCNASNTVFQHSRSVHFPFSVRSTSLCAVYEPAAGPLPVPRAVGRHREL